MKIPQASGVSLLTAFCSMLLVVVSVASHAVDPIALVVRKVEAAVAKVRSLPVALGRRSRGVGGLVD